MKPNGSQRQVVVGLGRELKPHVERAARLIFSQIHDGRKGAVTKSDAVRNLVNHGLAKFESDGFKFDQTYCIGRMSDRRVRQEWFCVIFENKDYDRLESRRAALESEFGKVVSTNATIRYAIATGLEGFGLALKSEDFRVKQVRLSWRKRCEIYQAALMKLSPEKLRELGLHDLAKELKQ